MLKGPINEFGSEIQVKLGEVKFAQRVRRFRKLNSDLEALSKDTILFIFSVCNNPSCFICRRRGERSRLRMAQQKIDANLFSPN
jgi:hypothetical protein